MPSLTEADGARVSTDGGWARLMFTPAEIFTPWVLAAYGIRVRDGVNADEELQSSELSLGAGGTVRLGDDHRLDFGVHRRGRSRGGDTWNATVEYRLQF